ncbi:MAG TPA: hypothetical protein VH309_12310 [Elusimicrobiota bacterium]|jgi:hypothetical protein|nr:hypothetical protein [Elusimicrobiota bacterium]
MSTLTPVPVRRVAVYELMNHRRLESILVVTSDGENALRARLRRAPPAEAARWDLAADGVAVEVLAPHLPEDAAEEFVTAFMRRMSPRTWRFRVWRP